MTLYPKPTEALKPCPFCGNTPKLVKRDVEPQGDSWYGKRVEEFIECECGCCLFDGSFHERFYDAKERAPIAWNTRATDRDAEPAAMRSALEKWKGHFFWRQSPDSDGMHSIATKIIQDCLATTTAALASTAGAELLERLRLAVEERDALKIERDELKRMLNGR